MNTCDRRRFVENFLTVIAIICVFLSSASFIQDDFTFFAVARGVSMQPILADNDLILFTPYQLMKRFHRAGVGDIIVYRAPAIPRIWAHRIVKEMEPGVFQTKGDNNPWPDSFRVKEDDILGVVPVWGDGHTITIPALGWIVLKWQSTPALQWGALATVMVLLMIAPSENRRHARRKRLRRRPTWHRLAVAGGYGVLLCMVTFYPFLSKSGYSSVGYRVAEGEGISYGGSAPISLGIIKQGETKSVKRPVTNGGVFPMIVAMEAKDPLGEVQVKPPMLVLPPRTTKEIAVEVEARTIGEWRQVPLSLTTAPYVMPLPWLASLAHKHPLLPNLVVSGGASLFSGTLVFLLLGKSGHKRRVRRCRRWVLAGYMKWMGLAPLGMAVVLAFTLSGVLASTHITVESIVAASFVSVPSDQSTIAWRTAPVEVGPGASCSVELFEVDNNYALDVWVETAILSDCDGVLTELSGSEWVGSQCTGEWYGTLSVPEEYPPGRYSLEFRLRAFTGGGGFITKLYIPVDVEVRPPADTIGSATNAATNLKTTEMPTPSTDSSALEPQTTDDLESEEMVFGQGG